MEQYQIQLQQQQQQQHQTGNAGSHGGAGNDRVYDEYNQMQQGLLMGNYRQQIHQEAQAQLAARGEMSNRDGQQGQGQQQLQQQGQRYSNHQDIAAAMMDDGLLPVNAGFDIPALRGEMPPQQQQQQYQSDSAAHGASSTSNNNANANARLSSNSNNRRRTSIESMGISDLDMLTQFGASTASRSDFGLSLGSFRSFQSNDSNASSWMNQYNSMENIEGGGSALWDDEDQAQASDGTSMSEISAPRMVTATGGDA